jgi:hypothetical protein
VTPERAGDVSRITEPRDSWGFTDADHAELSMLMRRHDAHMPDVMLALMTDGIAPMPEDPGVSGWIAREVPDASRRVFPAGEFQRALLDRLREIDRETPPGGAPR